ATTSTIDDGGCVQGIHKGYFRRKIAEASYRFSEECEAGDRVIVGVNEYVDPNEDRQVEILTISEEVETTQVETLKAFKAKRDNAGVQSALEAIREAARNGDNVMPTLIEGALANCTLGEMVQAMADIYGRYTGGPEW
ncbi:MAG: methylmalonyl-CoA mutase family protein, partial [Phycisphaerales bacterium]